LTTWDKSEGNLITAQMAVGVKVAGAWRRLIQMENIMGEFALTEKACEEMIDAARKSFLATILILC